MMSCVRPVESGYANAMPVAVAFGSAQGAGPHVREMLNTFLPDGRGVNDPVLVQPLPDVVTEPLPVTLTEMLSRVVLTTCQLPATALSDAGVP